MQISWQELYIWDRSFLEFVKLHVFYLKYELNLVLSENSDPLLLEFFNT